MWEKRKNRAACFFALWPKIELEFLQFFSPPLLLLGQLGCVAIIAFVWNAQGGFFFFWLGKEGGGWGWETAGGLMHFPCFVLCAK